MGGGAYESLPPIWLHLRWGAAVWVAYVAPFPGAYVRRPPSLSNENSGKAPPGTVSASSFLDTAWQFDMQVISRACLGRERGDKKRWREITGSLDAGGDRAAPIWETACMTDAGW